MLLACFAPIFLTILPSWSLSPFFFRYKQCIAKKNINGVLLVFIWFPESRIILNNKTRHLYMLRIAYQTAGPIGLKFFVNTYGWSIFFHGQRRALRLVYVIKQDIRIYVPYIWPNGWTKLDKFFWGNPWIPWVTWFRRWKIDREDVKGVHFTSLQRPQHQKDDVHWKLMTSSCVPWLLGMLLKTVMCFNAEIIINLIFKIGINHIQLLTALVKT